MRIFPLDKLFHLMAGYIIAITLMPLGVWWALGVCALIMAIKEGWDASGRGTVEGLDFFAGVGGGILGVGARYFLDILTR